MRYLILVTLLAACCNTTNAEDGGTSASSSGTTAGAVTGTTSGSSSGTIGGTTGGTTGSTTGSSSGTTGGTTGGTPHPMFESATPVGPNLEVVATYDNLALSDAGVTSLAVDGGTIVANQAACVTTACADFTVSGISGLGPVDGSGNIGTAVLTLSFPDGGTTNPGSMSIANGHTSVTFPGVMMPELSYPYSGTVKLILLANDGDTDTATWEVLTDILVPPSPTPPSVTMTDKRLASATLNWTDVTQGDDSPIANYEVSYLAVQFDNNTSADAGPYYPAGWQFEPLVDPTLETYIATGLPPLNQYELELRSVDSVGNRSPLIDTVSTTDMAPGVANTWQVQTVTDPNDLNSDFGYVLRSGDFNNDGKQDFVITAPYQYEANPTPGIVYIMDGVTDPSTVTFAGLTAITLGGTAYDWFGQDAHVADYNGDGIDDLAIGAPDWDGGQGQVVIYFGHTGTGLSATPDVTIFGTTTEASLFGYSVNAADVNGDGIPDLLVGAPGTSGGNGAVYLYLASATTWPANPTPTTEITGELGYGVGARWGTVSIGDINGDDAGDFIVSSPGGGDFNGDAGSGNSYGISGATALANATISVSDPTKVMFTIIGRINGFCDPMNDGYNSSAGMGEIWTFWGCYGSNAIGDVSFTGGALPDLVVASTYYSGFYLYQMGATGPTDAPPALPEYQVADPTGAFWSLINTDLNGDGSQDILVGENGGNQNVYLFLNDGTGLNNPQNNGVGLNAPYSGAIFGTLGSFFGYGLAAGDFQGISKPDFVVSDVFPGGTSMPYVNIYY